MRLVRPPEDGINRMSVAMAFLPLGLWIFGFISGLAVGAFCVVAGAVSPSARSRISEVRPVPWSMVLLHLVSAQEEDVAKAYRTVKHELEAYGGGITDKPEIVALSQIDVLDEDELKKKSKALAKACGQTPLQLSAVANVGMIGTLRAVRDIIVQAKNSGSDD